MFELKRDEQFNDLALDAFFRSEKEARANCMVSVEPPCCFCRSHVAIDCFYHAIVVDAVVLKEAAVLDGQHGIDEVLRISSRLTSALGAIWNPAQAGDQKGSSS